MAKTLDQLSYFIESLNRRIQALEETVKSASVTSLRQPDPLALPSSSYSIEEDHKGRAYAYFNGKCLLSTVSWMHALKECHVHYLAIDDSNLSIQWRKLKTGWVWWFSTLIDGEWVASEDFSSLQKCILEAHRGESILSNHPSQPLYG